MLSRGDYNQWGISEKIEGLAWKYASLANTWAVTLACIWAKHTDAVLIWWRSCLQLQIIEVVYSCKLYSDESSWMDWIQCEKPFVAP